MFQLVERCSILSKSPAPDVNFKLILKDLLLSENWIDYLPGPYKHTLWYLKALALIKLNQNESAQEAIENAQDTIGASDLSVAKKRKRMEQLEKGLEKVLEKGGKDGKEPRSKAPPKMKVNSANQSFPALSSKVTAKLLSPHNVGIVATEDILPGELILVEDPIFTIGYFKQNLNFCHFCSGANYHLISCRNCIALFCNQDCLEKALNSFHRYECSSGIPLLNCSMDKRLAEFVKLTLRVLFTLGLESLLQNGENVQYSSTTKFANFERVGPKAPFLSDSWETYFDLGLDFPRATYEMKDIQNSQTVVHSAVAIFIVENILKKVNYYAPAQKEIFSQFSLKEQKIIHGAIMKIMRLNFSNYRVLEKLPFDTNVNSKDGLSHRLTIDHMGEPRGEGVYSTASLINHSCLGNVDAVYSMQGRLAMCAYKFIPKGEEITFNRARKLITMTCPYERQQPLLEHG